MKVQCGQCPAKYAVADERVRDKKVRIRCRRCNAAIVVDGKVSPPLVTSTPARRSVGPFASDLPPHRDAGLLEQSSDSVPPPSTPEPESRPSPRPVAHTLMGGLEVPMARQLVTDHLEESQTLPLFGAVPQPRAGTLTGTGSAHELDPLAGMPERNRGFTEPPLRGEADRWRVALTQQDLRWMTTEEITEAFRDGAVKTETFVFRTGMPTWVTLLEVSEIARALSDAQLVSAPLQPSELDERDSSPPARISSLPPPRKATRQRSAGSGPDTPTGADAGNDSDESSPFELVSERANGAKRSEEVPDAEEQSEPPPSPAPDSDAATVANQPTPLSPPTAEALASSSEPAGAAAPLPSPLQSMPPAASKGQPGSGGSMWIWVVVVVLLLVGAAAFFLGPRVGLRLN